MEKRKISLYTYLDNEQFADLLFSNTAYANNVNIVCPKDLHVKIKKIWDKEYSEPWRGLKLATSELTPFNTNDKNDFFVYQIGQCLPNTPLRLLLDFLKNDITDNISGLSFVAAGGIIVDNGEEFKYEKVVNLPSEFQGIVMKEENGVFRFNRNSYFDHIIPEPPMREEDADILYDRFDSVHEMSIKIISEFIKNDAKS